MLVAHLVSRSDVHTVCHGVCVPVHVGDRSLPRCGKLAFDQRKRVAVKLAALDAQSALTVLIEGRFACGATCLHCKAMHVIWNGHANGLQRYRCRQRLARADVNA